MYHAKNPQKKKLKLRLEKCWRIVIEDETETEVWDDFCFGSKDEARSTGEKALRELSSLDPKAFKLLFPMKKEESTCYLHL